MSPEGHKPSEIYTTLAVIGGLFLLSQFAFSLKVRKQIGRRDHWTCQNEDCDDGEGQPKKYQNGYIVHASHKPEHHLKSDPIYDTSEAGDIRCIEHHLEQHEEGTTLPKNQNDYAIRQLKKTDTRTVWWRKKTGQ